MSAIDVPDHERRRLTAQLHDWLDQRRSTVADGPVSRPADADELRAWLARYDFSAPVPPDRLLSETCALLTSAGVDTSHPRYLGLFNPATTTMGVLADTIVAELNPQLAAWSHAPAAVEVERHLLRHLASLAGLDGAVGSFSSGGAEANLSAVLVALTRSFPSYADGGLRALPAQPVFYASADSHLAWLKIAHATGLGRDSLRLVATSPTGGLDPDALRRHVEEDRSNGLAPFLVAATAGTTGAGELDPLDAVSDMCEDHGLGLHVDAAWAGAVLYSPRHRELLEGVQRAGSLTVDAHKWLSVPMGAGMFLCTDAEALARTFAVSTSYMPGSVDDTADPYTHSLQWSRRFIGLKVFLALAASGVEGYAAQVDHDVALGHRLREGLREDGWTVVNHTELPVVCFVDPDRSDAEHERIAAEVVADGRAWVSTTGVRGRTVLRACLTHHRTSEEDLVVVREALASRRTPGG